MSLMRIIFWVISISCGIPDHSVQIETTNLGSAERTDIVKPEIISGFLQKVINETYERSSREGCISGSLSQKCNLTKLFRRKKRQVGRPVVGTACEENIECQTFDGGATCREKRCRCLGNFVSMNGYCWRRISPGETGCLYTEQCTAVWPDTVCSAFGTCVCGNNRPPHPNKDGPICVAEGECPTNGAVPRLRNAAGGEVMCNGRDDLCMDTLIYDCICNPIPTALGTDACTGESYCCPSRALTCAMPSDPGQPAIGVSPSFRYYYNSVTGRCEQFAYSGSGGNANNFVTSPQCNGYCSLACSRASAEYTSSKGAYHQRRCLTTADKCGKEFSCSDTYCCPSRGTICSVTGGITYPGAAPTAADPGVASYGITPSIRYFYDSNTGLCTSFTYNGVGGNFNNFYSETHCRAFCLRICGIGEPLKDSSGSIVRCPPIGNVQCPSQYSCTRDSFCCASPDFVCRLSIQTGPCTNSFTRFAYDAVIGDCVSFTYSGCQGNLNNFKGYDDCMSTCSVLGISPKCPVGRPARNDLGIIIRCGGPAAVSGADTPCPSNYFCYSGSDTFLCCPTMEQTCLIEDADSGTVCGNPAARFYFNRQTRTCESFRYNGCDGNSNNFATRRDCEDYCKFTGCPDHGRPYSENGIVRGCYSVGSSSVDCPSGYICSALSPAFVDLNLVVRSYCCPTKSHICSLPVNIGIPCGSPLTRHHFNSKNRQCESFTYAGCGGNDNNFPTAAACRSFCLSAGCPYGQVAMTGTGANGEQISCEANRSGWTTCSASNGICVESELLNSTLCCGSNAPASICPFGQRAYVDSVYNQPRQCSPNIDACPAGYACNYDPVTRNSYCCGLPVTPCPEGSTLLSDGTLFAGMPQPVQCTPDLPGSCPESYFCQPVTVTISNIASTTGHCCSLANPCGVGYTPYRVNSRPVTCNTTSNCPAPYDCLRKTCCAASSTVLNVCPIGREPFYRNGGPTLCVPGSKFASCPFGYTCNHYPQANVFYCCGPQTVTTTTTAAPTTRKTTTAAPNGCPPHSEPVKPLSYCSPNTFSPQCPNNSFCTYDNTRRSYICCYTPTDHVIITTVKPTTKPAHNATTSLPPAARVCPGDRAPALDRETSRPVSCSETRLCSRGYTCVYTPNGNYCCNVTGDSGCPNNTTPYVYDQQSSKPLACVPNGRRCPNGFECVRHAVTRTLYQCCSKVPSHPPEINHTRTAMNDGDCPVGTAPFIYHPTESPLTCIPNGAACPFGYSCTQSRSFSDYRCCTAPASTTVVSQTALLSRGGGCPAGSAPYLYPSTGALLGCAPNKSQCPSGYQCVHSDVHVGSMICCRNVAIGGAKIGVVSNIFVTGDSNVKGAVGNGARAGEPCQNDAECRRGAGPNAVCRNGICVCASNEVDMSGTCTASGCPHPYRNIAGKCVVK